MSNQVSNQCGSFSTNGSTTTCVIQSNNDVLGIGIRVNFYSTMILLAVIPRTPLTEELLNVLYANTGIAGLGLLVTAIQQSANQELSFFHAIFVQHILFFLGIGVAPVGKYNWSRSRIAMGLIIQFASVIAFLVWAVYLWAHANDFGCVPECNGQVKYVLMFVNVRATAPWLRGLWIAVLVASALVLLVIFGYNALTLYATRNDKVVKTEESEKEWYFSISFRQILSAIYCIIMLELTVHRNDINHGGIVTIDGSWQFGQTLAVIMIFANINEIIHCIFGFFAPEREGSHEGQEEAQQTSDGTDVPPASTPYRPRGFPGSHLSTRDASHSSEHELSNLTGNSHVSQITVGGDSDQPVGTLR